jgi:hypothetical protein
MGDQAILSGLLYAPPLPSRTSSRSTMIRLARHMEQPSEPSEAAQMRCSKMPQMPRVLEEAIRAALGQRGVAVIVISGDTALREAIDAPAPRVGGGLGLYRREGLLRGKRHGA